MNNKLRLCAYSVLTVLVLAVGCRKQEAQVAASAPLPGENPPEVELVKQNERSAHFLAVTKHLELGGTLYGYVDIDGDVQKLSESLRQMVGKIAERQPGLKSIAAQDFAALSGDLGLTDIKAVGLSSVPVGPGEFRNRVFLFLPGPRRGLLAGLGGAPADFQRLNLAPADSDLYSESEIDLPEIYKAVYAIVDRVGGKEASGKLEKGLTEAGRGAAFSLLQLIQNWKGRMVMVGRFDGEKIYAFPGQQPFMFPRFSLFLAIDGIAPALRETLDQAPGLVANEIGAMRVYLPKQRVPVSGLKPVLAIQGSTLLVATSSEYLNECALGGGGLAQTDAFRQALAKVGDQGNSLSYVTPRFFSRLQDIGMINPGLPPDKAEMVQMILKGLPQPTRAMVSVRSNLEDGILINSRSNASLKKNVMMLSVYNPVTVGLMAAMAIPAFQKVRATAQEKAVLNNLRQLAAAADQYYLEHGVETVTYDELVGPDKYIRQIPGVDGEDYRTLTFRLGSPLRIAVPSLHKVVEYNP